MTETTRAGFAAVIGAPNAGKSTLVNRLVGSKVSIVTQKVQTTRFPVRGVAMAREAQIVLVDTPGIFKPRRRLDRAMVRSAWGGAEDADVVVHLVDAAGEIAVQEGGAKAGEKRSVEDAHSIIAGLKSAGRTAILALNKIDLIKRDKLLAVSHELFEHGVYSEVFMISAANGSGVEDLKTRLAELMPEGPWLYPEDQTADLPARLLAAEITREKLYLRLHEELPYAASVETTAFTETQGWRLPHRADRLCRARGPAPDHARQGRPDPEMDRRSLPHRTGHHPRPPGAPVPAREGQGELGRGARVLQGPGPGF